MLLGKRSPWKNDFSPWKVLDFFPKKFCMNHATLTIWFSLDCKWWCLKQSQNKMETFRFIQLCLWLQFFKFTRSCALYCTLSTPHTTVGLWLCCWWLPEFSAGESGWTVTLASKSEAFFCQGVFLSRMWCLARMENHQRSKWKFV